MTEIRTVRHGPFSGYVSALAKDLIPLDAVGPDSRDWRYNPTLGKWVERGGSVILGDTLSSGLPVAGLVVSPYFTSGLRTRQIFEFPQVLDQAGAQQFSDGYPSYGALYDIASSPTVTRTGWLYVRSSNSGGSNQFPGKSWSATTYPKSGTKSFLKALPTWHQAVNVSSRLGSGIDVYQKNVYGGGRRVLVSGKWLYTVGEHVDSRRWNMLFNDSSSSPTRKERHWPMGILPVLFPAWIKAADFPTPNQIGDTWKEGDSFYMSACYVFEDGTWGPPFIPGGPQGAQVAGGYNTNYGLVTLKSGAPDATWSYIAWRNIAQPPPGCIGTALLRSRKVNVATAPGSLPPLALEDQSGQTITNFDMRVIAVIPVGQTSYNDSKGDDTALLLDLERVRTDHISPYRGRYIGAFDGRTCIGGNLRLSPQLIYLAHTGTTNPNDNTDDDDATLGATQYFIQVNGTNLLLRKATASPGWPQAPTSNTIAMSGKTLSEVVALINATTPASTTGEWRAQLAPGVVGSEPASRIMDTRNNDYGDDGLPNDSSTGNMRSFAQGYPAVLQWDQAAYIALEPWPDREGFWFTRSAPQSAARGVTSAPNFWVAGNYRKPPEYSGAFMGMAPLENGMVVFYTDKVWLFRNTYANRSGLDQDYYFALLSNDGCIAWDSIVSFNNAVGWLSPKGYKVWGEDVGEKLITAGDYERGRPGGIYDPTENTGDLAYEIPLCAASAGADTDDMRFHAQKFGHVLVIKYRISAGVWVEHEYDFSEGTHSGGASELLRADGGPFGWSTPFRRPGETMGSFRNSTGTVRLHAIEAVNAGLTGTGRIDQMETGYQDNGTAIATLLYTRMDDQGEVRRRTRERRFTAKYRSPVGHVMTVTHSRDRARTSATTYTLENSSSLAVTTQTKRVKLAGQAPARVSEYRISGTRVAAAPAEFWMLEREVKVLDTPVETAG